MWVKRKDWDLLVKKVTDIETLTRVETNNKKKCVIEYLYGITIEREEYWTLNVNEAIKLLAEHLGVEFHVQVSEEKAVLTPKVVDNADKTA